MVAQYETARQHAALRARIRGAFLGCMLGDAIGRPFEMMSVDDRRLGPALDRRLRRTGPWSYTDDSQMMISVAESLVRRRGLCPDDLLATLAFFTFLRWEPGFVRVVKNTVWAGGDTDTTTAMSGALCGARLGEEGLPATWLDRMEGGPKGSAT